MAVKPPAFLRCGGPAIGSIENGIYTVRRLAEIAVLSQSDAISHGDPTDRLISSRSVKLAG